MIDREQRIPDHILYGAPEECHLALSKPLRCTYDPYWRWPDIPKVLPFWQRWQIDRALAQRIRRKRYKR